MVQYETIIGLEVHAQLLTAAKMFCGCSAAYASAPPNTHVCPVCMALPGVLPVMNRAAVEKTIIAGLALNCRIGVDRVSGPSTAVFARKNYHYADLPKGYQISQYEWPLCVDGWLDIQGPAGLKRIGITRAHLEEDTGKLVHVGEDSGDARLSEGQGGQTLVDLNRAGVPLLEIVTEPELCSSDEAQDYLVRLQALLRHLDVSLADMERGAMRCEANISVRPVGQESFGTKVEIKNLNSFRSVRLSLEYEAERQIALIESGGRVEQVTMGWDEESLRTVVQRSKESADDYRYFPEPDLPPLILHEEWIADFRSRLPELPSAREDRFIKQLGLGSQEAALLVADRKVADYYEAALSAVQARMSGRLQDPPAMAKTVANWVTIELFRLMNATGAGVDASRVSPEGLAELLALVSDGGLNLNSAKRALDAMFTTGRSASEIVEELALAQNSDVGQLSVIIQRVISHSPGEVAKYQEGKQSVFGWLMGQIMRESQGKANPKMVKELLSEALARESRGS